MGFVINNGVIVGLNGEVNVSDLLSSVASNRVTVNTATREGQSAAFRKSSVVQTAVRRRVNAFSNLNVWAKDAKGKKVYNKFVDEDLRKMQRWNKYQDFNAFNNLVESQACIYGVCYIWKMKLIGVNEYEYYVVPNSLISPKNLSFSTNSLFERKATSYNVSLPTGDLELGSDEIIEIKDNWFINNDGQYGLSRLSSLSEPISTLLSIGEMTTQLIADGGARGIIGQGAKDVDMITSPFLNKEKDEIQKALKQYGGLRNQFKYIVTKGAASYVPLTSKIVDMQLPALVMDAKVAIFEVFGLPNIFSVHETRYKSLPEARKEFYTGTIIPEATPRFRDLVRIKGIPQRDWEYKPDWSHMDFFQESLKEGAVALQQAINGVLPAYRDGILSKEECRAIIEPYIE